MRPLYLTEIDLEIPKCHYADFLEVSIRINSQTTKLNKHPQLARNIYNSYRDWSAELLPNVDIDCLDEAAIHLARERFKQEHPNIANEVDTWSNITLMEKMMLAQKGILTRAAIILLGKPESNIYLSPAVAEITWRLQSNSETAYEHFGPPFLLNTNLVLTRIRNYRQRLFPETSLFPEEVMKYEPEVFLEALHNCIAHQDYSKHARIVVTEREDCLIFNNQGNFYYGKPDDYLTSDETPVRYRNKLLATVMKSLRMVDTVGYGIRKMYQRQMKRCFPLPDYTIHSGSVELRIHGKSIDDHYTKLLMAETNMPLEYAIALDRVQKRLPISDSMLTILRNKGFVEGSKNHLRISHIVAAATGQKIEYIKAKGVDRNLIKKHVLNMLADVGAMSRKEISSCIEQMLPSGYSETRKYNFVTSLIRDMSKIDGSICNCSQSKKNAKWILNQIKIK